MRRILLTTLTLLLGSSCSRDIAACSDWVADPRSHVSRGIVRVNFNESVRTEAQATRVVEDAWLQISSFVAATFPLSAFVSVPEGSECASAERLNANPAIETAEPAVWAID